MERTDGKIAMTAIVKTVLAVVGTAGIIAVAIAAPGVVHALGTLKRYQDTSKRRYYVRSVIANLTRAGYLQKTEQKGKAALMLTEKGKRQLVLLGQNKVIPKRWDGKWRIVTFDVYEKLRSRRDAFRAQLKEYGFIQMQRSVWIYPYPCEEFVALLKSDNSFGKNIRYIVADSVDQDTALRSHFKIS